MNAFYDSIFNFPAFECSFFLSQTSYPASSIGFYPIVANYFFGGFQQKPQTYAASGTYYHHQPYPMHYYSNYQPQYSQTRYSNAEDHTFLNNLRNFAKNNKKEAQTYSARKPVAYNSGSLRQLLHQ